MSNSEITDFYGDVHAVVRWCGSRPVLQCPKGHRFFARRFPALGSDLCPECMQLRRPPWTPPPPPARKRWIPPSEDYYFDLEREADIAGFDIHYMPSGEPYWVMQDDEYDKHLARVRREV